METIHPIIVHFPIALLLTATFIGLLAVFLKNKREELKIVLYWLLILGGISILIAFASGLYEAGRVVHNEAIHEIMETHELLGYIITSAFVLITLWFVIRRRKIKTKELTLIAFLLLASSGVLVYSAYLGGQMVYEQGAGVKPMEKMMLEMHGGEHHHGAEDSHDAGEMMEHTHGGTDAVHQEMINDSANHHAADSVQSPARSHDTGNHSHDGHTH